MNKKSLPLFSLSWLFLLGFFALFGPMFSPYSHTEISLAMKNSPPSATFWLGSDELGRDLFTRICIGARISLFIGSMAALIDMAIGVFWGMTAAYSNKKIEEFMMRFCDILHAIPYLLIVILLTLIRGTGMFTVLLAITLTGWINMARICKNQTLVLKKCDFLLAAKALGASHWRILFFHLLPNLKAPILASVTLTIPSAIFTEAFLSFLGLGIQAPAASWGIMIHDGLSAMRYYPWRLFFPALVTSITILSFHLLSNKIGKK